MKLVVIFLFLVLNQLNAYWLGTCIKANCEDALKLCNGCYGEHGCKSCVSSLNLECIECVNDIYNKNDLDIIGSAAYMICDSQDSLQVNACHLFCRGQYIKTGNCIDNQNIPICQCNNNQQTTIGTKLATLSSSSTTTTTKTKTSPYILNLDFKSKLNVSFQHGNYPILSLPNGDLLRSSDMNIQIWDTEKGVIKRNLTSSIIHPWLLGLLSNGDLVATYGGLLMNQILVWDMNETSKEPVKRILETHFPMGCLTVLKNDDLAFGPFFNRGNEEDTLDIMIMDSKNGLIKQRLVGHSKIVRQLIELSNNRLVSCSDDKTVKVWNLLNGTLIHNLQHPERVESVALLKNGQLACGLYNGHIHIWNIDDGTYVRTIFISKYPTERLKVLNNGYLLGGSSFGYLKIWNPDDGTLKSSFDTNQLILRMEFLSNGKLVTSSNDDFIVWS
ncbi:unnamed protein product [Brachionus calyciflorus]|uniref:Uncharacterized protein n=1 Tax=Brachionus calyciflorus TaxID=104777 RepID=A0A813ME26_9BILA|nr:unnamed protein product [Brachionus calyciflorus]